jgi:ABC-type transporter Mla subunit MlaD
MTIKNLLAAALAVTDEAGDAAFDALAKTDEMSRKLAELRKYLDDAPRSASRLVASAITAGRCS